MRISIFIAFYAAQAFAQSAGYEQGAALVQQGRHAEAVPILERAAQAHPEDARVWSALGVAFASQGMYDLAAPPFHRACSLNPGLGDGCYFEARALYALDRFEASIAVLQRAAPGSWKIELAIAQAQEGLGNAHEAEERFQKSRTLARNTSPQPDAALALFLLRQGRPAAAAALLEDTVRRFPNDPEAQLHMGHALLEQDRFSEAIPHLTAALQAQPASTQAHLLLAKAYLRSGRASEAQPHFAAAQK